MSDYSHDIRLLACPRCGAPLEVPAQGGLLTCEYCGGTSELAPRNEPATAHEPRSSEQERRARLWEQLEMSTLAVPADIAALIENQMLPDEQLQPAMRMFLEERAKLVAGQEVAEASERLFVLTLLITQALSRHQGTTRRSRALIETAAELLPSPAHQQQLRAKLAAGCAKLGDIEGAEAWLALLDPYSESIHADSAYRHARACVDTVRGDWPAVIRVLGETMEEVPIVGELGIFVDCLRANALERMGDLEAAVRQLLVNMQRPSLRPHVEMCIQINPNLDMCPQSLALAQQVLAQQS